MSLFDRLQGNSREKLDAEIEKGKAFLAKNKERPEVTETASGLQYEVLVEGTGPKPGPTTKVTTHYHGTTIDGNVFDSSVQRGQPLSFGLNQVIPGWTEGLQLMPVGSKYRLFIPHNLAYGERGAGGSIPGGAALIFDVELISI
ncbi:MAG: FKBP-type peptidyl-prolyl cis-trans isomerase [Chitinophagaceae bacterium]